MKSVNNRIKNANVRQSPETKGCLQAEFSQMMKEEILVKKPNEVWSMDFMADHERPNMGLGGVTPLQTDRPH